MDLPVMPSVAPMLAQSAETVPEGDYFYEPKWDGFRSIVFVDPPEVELGSRGEKSLTRYFPEVVTALLTSIDEPCVLDGEIVIEQNGFLDFDLLSQRIHPAESRIKKLSVEIPARFIAFDLLAADGKDFRSVPFVQRRERLAKLLAKSGESVDVTPATRSAAEAEAMFDKFEGAGIDGIVAKSADLLYIENKRLMTKIKRTRTADCVIAGYRTHKDGKGVGSLMLGLWNDNGTLHYMGVATSFSAKVRADLLAQMKEFETDKDHPWLEESIEARAPGALNRWNSGKDMSWTPLRPELVCEVAYGHVQDGRFRHATKLKRFRPDRTADSCTLEQLVLPDKANVDELLAQ